MRVAVARVRILEEYRNVRLLLPHKAVHRSVRPTGASVPPETSGPEGCGKLSPLIRTEVTGRAHARGRIRFHNLSRPSDFG